MWLTLPAFFGFASQASCLFDTVGSRNCNGLARARSLHGPKRYRSRGPPLDVLTGIVVLDFVAPSHRTASLPDDQRGTFFDGVDLITALRQRGTDVEHVLLAGQPTFSIGSSPSCDISVEGGYLSTLHCVLERRGQRIRVHDQASKNGTFFSGRRESQFDIGPGDSFVAASTTFLALNEEMRLARPVVSEILGTERFEAIDDLLMVSVRGSHVVVHAEPGNDQARLARAIHTASLRRRYHLVTASPATANQSTLDRQVIEHATGGTLLLQIDPEGVSFEQSFVELLLAPTSNVRIIASALSLDLAIRALGAELVGRSHQVTIGPVRERGGEIVSLLERWFIDRRSALRVTDFTEANRGALMRYRWPGNLEELRDAADRLVALAPHPSIRQAAPTLNISRSTLQRWLDAIGLTLPLCTIRPEDANE